MPIPGPPPVTPGVPDGKVLLDDGTGTFPTDISDRVEWSDGVTVNSYGRTDEFSTAQSAQLTLTVDNTDGTLTVGAGKMSKGQQIRFQMTKGSTTRNRFTGRVTSLGLGWPGGADTYATLAVTAMDRLTDCAGVRLRSMLEQEILLRSPSAYYTLGEPEGSKTAGDTSGNQGPALRQAGSGTAVTFGSGTGPTDGLTTATFAGGKYLTNALSPGASYSELIAFSRASAPSNQEILFTIAHELLVLETDGKLSLYAAPPGGVVTPLLQSSASVCDGGIHFLGWSVQSGTGYQLFVDGATSSVANAAAGTLAYLIDGLVIGGSGSLITPASNLTGNVSHVAHFDGVVLSATDVANLWTAVLGFAGETTTERFTRLASYGGITVSTVGMSDETVGPQATSGTSLLDAFNVVATAEGGVLYADGDGTVVLQGRAYRAGKTTADLTLPAEDLISPDVTDDNQQTVTFATVTRTGGATQTVGTSTPGIEDGSLDLIVDSDQDALYAGQWLVAKHADPDPRMGSAAFDLTTSDNAEAFLGADVGDRLALTGMPDQLPASFGDQTIEGWSETVTDQTWSLTANVLPFTLFEALVLDDAVEGLLGTAVLGY